MNPRIANVEMALHSIIDPCSRTAGVPASLMEMGMITHVGVSDGVVDVTLQLTEPTCVVGPVFMTWIRDAVMEVDGVDDVKVKLDLSFGWDPSRLDPDYRERLAEHHAARGADPVRTDWAGAWASVEIRR